MRMDIVKAISEPTRLKILETLREGELCACEIPEKVRKSQPVVSQHLAVLKDKEIVDSSIDGNKRIYHIVDPIVRNIIRGFDEIFSGDQAAL